MCYVAKKVSNTVFMFFYVLIDTYVRTLTEFVHCPSGRLCWSQVGAMSGGPSSTHLTTVSLLMTARASAKKSQFLPTPVAPEPKTTVAKKKNVRITSER